MSKKAYIWTRGGMGDVFWWYVNHPEWRKLSSIKSANPDAEIDAIVITGNSNASKILDHHPCITRTKTFLSGPDGSPGQDPQEHAGDSQPLASCFNLASYPMDSVRFYLDEEEKRKACRILDAGRYCVLHPFAGHAERTFLVGGIDIYGLIPKIIAKGFNVVVVGGDSIRHEAGADHELRESFSMHHEKVFDLTNQYSPRLHAYLTWHASRFVGAFSCFCVLAIYAGMPGVTLAPINLKPYFDNSDVYFRDIRQSGLKLIYFSPDVTYHTVANSL